MAKEQFVIADLHFGHKGICEFVNYDGTKTRPWDTPEDMDEALVSNWNSVVGEFDRVYVLGDVAINNKAIKTIGRCNGKKVLVKGNHDIFKLKDYLPYFEDIRAYKVDPKEGYIMSHIPIHPDCIGRFRLNIHGHLHANTVKETVDEFQPLPGLYDPSHKLFITSHQQQDERYRCVSVEQINFTPMNLREIVSNS